MIAQHIFSIINKKNAPYLAYIKKGIKHAEGRINATKCRKIKVGDMLLFQSKSEGIFCKATFLHPYPTFSAMLQKEGVERMLPQLRQKEASLPEKIAMGVEIYGNFRGAHRINELGCVAIGVEFLADGPGRLF